MMLSAVGRKQRGVRLLVAAIYLLLTLGGLAMVAPFLITVTGAFSNALDIERYALYPRYWFNEEDRYLKFLADKYDDLRFEYFASAYRLPADWSSFRDLGFQERAVETCLPVWPRRNDGAALERIAADYREFLATCGAGNQVPLFQRQSTLAWQDFLQSRYTERWEREAGRAAEHAGARMRYECSLARLAQTWEEGDYSYWDQITLEQERYYPFHMQRWYPPDSARYRDFLDFLASLPPERKMPVTQRYLWHESLRNEGLTVQDWNQRFGTAYRGLPEVPAPAAPPVLSPAARHPFFYDPAKAEKRAAGRTDLYYRFHVALPYWPPTETTLPSSAREHWEASLRAAWPAFVKAKFASVEAYNAAYAAGLTRLEDAAFPALDPGLDAVWEKRLEPAWRRYLRQQFGSVEKYSERFGVSFRSFDLVPYPERAEEQAALKWRSFLRKLWTEFLVERFGTIGDVNLRFGTSFARWEEVPYPQQARELADALWQSFIHTEWTAFLKRRCASVEQYNQRPGRTDRVVYASLDDVPPPRRGDPRAEALPFAWWMFLRSEPLFGEAPNGWWQVLPWGSFALPWWNRQLGAAHRDLYEASLQAVELDREVLLAELYRSLQENYWPYRLVELPESAGPLWKQYLVQRFITVEAYNLHCGTHHTDLAGVPLPRTAPARGEERQAWTEFVQTLDAKTFRLLAPEFAYRDFLKRKYANAAALNAAYGWQVQSFDEADLPAPEVDLYDYQQHRGPILRGFLTDNFAQVWRFIAVRGGALPNTGILVLLTILFTLTVNPVAAYALSRFRLKWTQVLLIYLLATMSFPPEIALIPNFLLLRDFHFMNTFWALFLPGAANGFSIFLLKGFFDSLPRELYEAAELDGAREFTIFWHITMSLSKPILSVIALSAFLAAYGSFMWAFLVCQDPDMWTLMVWLYQFQQQHASEPHLVMAGLVLASVPTLLVFLFCQKIILRGIVLPVME